MKFFLIVIGVIMVFDLGKFIFYRAQKLPEITQSSQTLGEGEELVYVAAGDSTALGIGATKETKTYAYMVAEGLSDKNKVAYRNIGLSGSQTTDLIKNQLPQIVHLNPRIVTISVGANDVTHLRSVSSIVKNYQTIKSELLGKTDADVYVSNIPSLSNASILPLWFRKLLDHRVIRANQKIGDLESDRFHIVDIYHSIPYTPETYAQDQFHPSDEGYENWAQTFLGSMSEVQ